MSEMARKNRKRISFQNGLFIHHLKKFESSLKKGHYLKKKKDAVRAVKTELLQ